MLQPITQDPQPGNESGVQQSTTTMADKLQWMKEIVTALIALSVVISLLIMVHTAHTDPESTSVGGGIGVLGLSMPGSMLNAAPAGPKSSSAFDHDKDLLGFLMTLATFVMGYYFNKVTSDAHVSDALSRAATAGSRADLYQQANQLLTGSTTALADHSQQLLNVPAGQTPTGAAALQEKIDTARSAVNFARRIH